MVFNSGWSPVRNESQSSANIYKRRKLTMLKTIKILCVLLKVFMLMRTALTSSSKDQEDCTTQDNPSFRFIDVHEYVSSNIESVQYYFENDTMRKRNEVGETTPSSGSIPSEPTFPRAFVEFNDRLNQKDIFVTFRWNEPKFTNGVIQKYTVQYWFFENQIIHRTVVIISNFTILQHKVYNLKPDRVYYFEVQAHNKFGAGSYTKFINVSTTYENPVPLLLVKEKDKVYVLDKDLQIGFERDIYIYCTEYVYSALEHKIYGITYKSELITLQFNPNAIETNQNYTIIAEIRYNAYSLCIDWIGGSLYWLEETIDHIYIMKLDLILLQQKGIKTYEKIALAAKHTLFLRALPYNRHLYWIEDSSIVQTDFNGRNKLYMANNKCFCLKTFLGLLQYEYTLMTIDTTNIDEPLIYWIINNEYLIVTDINGCNCNMILKFPNQSIYRFDDIVIDSINIYLISYGYYEIYILRKGNALHQSKKNLFECLKKIHFEDGFFDFIALDKTLQSYPPKKCLISTKNYRVEEMLITANSIKVNLPEPNPNDECKKYNFTFIYNISVSYLKCLDNNLDKFEEFYVQTYERQYEFQNLTQLTEYTLKLALSNFYVHKLSMDLQFGPDVKLITTGKLYAPDDVVVQVVMPNLAIIDWMPPKKLGCVAVNYEVKWMQYSNSTQENQNLFRFIKAYKLERTTNGKFFAVIPSLVPKQKYEIYVSVYSIIRTDVVTDSVIKTIYISEPNNLSLNEVGTKSMNISWIPSVNLTIPIEFLILEYKNVASRKWRWTFANYIEVNNYKITYYVENLLPKTLYKFRLKLKYTEYREDFIWPSDGEEFIFETLGDARKISSATGTAMQYYLPLILCLIVIIVIYNVYYFYCTYRQRKRSNKIVSPPIMMNTELVPLNEIPFGYTQLNLLNPPRLQYNSDEFALTIIEKNQIIQTKFLGSGAFGSVYQGIIKDFEGLDTTPVAIKMLKRQASSKEKKEFLKEAKLMSHFRHKNVLRILGICLDTNSPLLILELIEPGDLLNYLRNNGTLQSSDSCALRLKDLLAMCEDVARGCCYLERQQFVHKDLACRNCLISVRNHENRIVKIGDFGLARDIYKDHYYRMKGDHPLPVRWMAPESLMFGIFTSQSDVWAFGVLMWEIMSLGEHPYPGKNYSEVIEYVREGGKLPKPLNCPPMLYQLMLHCWKSVIGRPNFTNCVKNIKTLRNNVEDSILVISSLDIFGHRETNHS
ncbi:proto-oncogene tyrosine-protein kinase ROS-like isoform X2 [Nylanderia fulva]|uniref:proto-oncogene tyrosine-protein kinase ROS-like isoform X2 n=1 Tax=Nylanderia fulva TaxID=613905 RepID=UPI0010FB7574|nr:proto-oncogene tyrosine-protein kinase ROS-like isoform X2 [Nylanderia fulva]